MMTSVKYYVAWSYTEGTRTVRRTLHAGTAEPCIEAARLISANPYAYDVEVRETDTDKEVEWKAREIGPGRAETMTVTLPQDGKFGIPLRTLVKLVQEEAELHYRRDNLSVGKFLERVSDQLQEIGAQLEEAAL